MTSTAVERVDEDGCIGLGHKLQERETGGTKSQSVSGYSDTSYSVPIKNELGEL